LLDDKMLEFGGISRLFHHVGCLISPGWGLIGMVHMVI